MESASKTLHHRLDSIITYLTPLLPIVNCHMVEFFTQNHWERLLPVKLRATLDKWELYDAVEKFWEAVEPKTTEKSELSEWVHNARSNCITTNDDYCLSVSQLQNRIKARGGDIKTEIRIKEFMTSKKSYEVQTMSRLVASLYNATNSTCCVEVGGGRGHLPVALSLGYSIPSLTIDCDDKTLASAEKRIRIIQKQWHAIAKKIQDNSEEEITRNIKHNLHQFAKLFVTEKTDLCTVVKEKFPEHSDQDVKLLLTGLHTCGNLGPDSLRLFVSNSSINCVFNVPCCYHLLSESVDTNMFDVFQRNYGDTCIESEHGFPMSEHLRGYNLGRNARMLAAQSIDRVVQVRQLPSKSLLYRALLQVIIHKYKPDCILSEGKLKGISSKCVNFEQYFKMADDILNLELYGTFSDSCLTEDVNCQWKKIVLFYFLRLCLAQVVESVILLDRLKFLLENGFDNVYLVKLFDPVLSPRCHSIVALRH